MTQVICSIAARGGSKGVPGKNLKQLGDRPLIAHAISAALQADSVDRVIVNTESREIADTARKYGAETPFLRDPDLADDHTPLLMVTRETMLQMEALGYQADIIIQLAATCPFTRPETIDRSVELALQNQCAVTLKRIEHEHPYRAKVLNDEGSFSSFITDVDVEAFQSRQDLPELYCTSGSVYTRTRDLLMIATGKDFCLGPKPAGIILSDEEAINIDRPIDFSFAELIMSKRNDA
jgi:CMP-N-acetylneuraminic acid synthetase